MKYCDVCGRPVDPAVEETWTAPVTPDGRIDFSLGSARWGEVCDRCMDAHLEDTAER